MLRENCRVLESDERVLEIDGLGQVLLVVDLTSTIPSEMMKWYSETNDKLGTECLTNITARISLSLSGFETKINNFMNEVKMTNLYLERFALTRPKRVDAGSIALLLSALSFAVSSTGLVITQGQIQDIHTRLDTMSRYIDEMKEYQKLMNENLSFLYKENQFVGVETNLLINYVNALKTIHSCQFINFYLEAVMNRLDDKLSDIFDNILDRKLSNEIIDRNILDNITSHRYFSKTIYMVNPSALYSFGQIDAISFKDMKLTMLLTFPKIGRRYKMKKVNILESPKRILSQDGDFENFHSFLIPISVNLANLSNNMDTVRSSTNCLKTKMFLACDINSVMPHADLLCLNGILHGIDAHCSLKDTFTYDFNVEYSRFAALVFLKIDAKIVDLSNDRFLHASTPDESKCIYLTTTKNIAVISPFRQEKLFQSTIAFHYNAEPVVKIQRMAFNLAFENFTAPRKNHTLKYKPVVFKDHTEDGVALIVAISVSCTLILTLLTIIIVKFGRCRRNVVDGSSLFH